ncbi:transmembrane protein 253 [Salarias fasciatus]|uniref:Uncharacterized LOC115392480 n=1 Tax=Salarias fasciatus TaxID=181472 RepID=A0A672GNQ7_SALFA|nr:uncharacterized protein LOC115392480 [Salarias fasciatus]
MTQNMFMEGLYQVFFRETPPARPLPPAANNEELNDVRIHRWFGSVVNSRLLVTGVVEVLSGLSCILTTVIHACVNYNCSVSMVTPVWPSILYVAAGCLAVEVQRKASRLKILLLMGLNLFCLLFGFSALLTNNLHFAQSAGFTTAQQKAGSYVAKASSITFAVLCCLASIYILFLSWRGLRRYSSPNIQVYSRVSEDDETTGPLLDQMELNL